MSVVSFLVYLIKFVTEKKSVILTCLKILRYVHFYLFIRFGLNMSPNNTFRDPGSDSFKDNS